MKDICDDNRSKFEEFVKQDITFRQVQPTRWKAEHFAHDLELELGDWPATPRWLLYLDGVYFYDSELLPRRWRLNRAKEFRNGGCLAFLLS
jgi:hypothetical protein